MLTELLDRYRDAVSEFADDQEYYGPDDHQYQEGEAKALAARAKLEAHVAELSAELAEHLEENRRVYEKTGLLLKGAVSDCGAVRDAATESTPEGVSVALPQRKDSQQLFDAYQDLGQHMFKVDEENSTLKAKVAELSASLQYCGMRASEVEFERDSALERNAELARVNEGISERLTDANLELTALRAKVAELEARLAATAASDRP